MLRRVCNLHSAGYIIIFLLKEGEDLAKFKSSYSLFYTSVVIICLNTKDDFLSHQLEYWLWAKAPLLSWKLLDHTILHKREQRSLDNHNCKNQNLVGFYKRSCNIFQRYSFKRQVIMSESEEADGEKEKGNNEYKKGNYRWFLAALTMPHWQLHTYTCKWWLALN